LTLAKYCSQCGIVQSEHKANWQKPGKDPDKPATCAVSDSSPISDKHTYPCQRHPEKNHQQNREIAGTKPFSNLKPAARPTAIISNINSA